MTLPPPAHKFYNLFSITMNCHILFAIFGVVALAALGDNNVNAFDCATLNGSAPITQYMTHTKSGTSIGAIKGDVTVGQLSGQGCPVTFNIEIPNTLNPENLSWYERPKSDTNAGRKIQSCNVTNGKHECIIPHTTGEPKFDSIALYEEGTTSVYATVEIAGGASPPVGANTANPEAEAESHTHGNGTQGEGAAAQSPSPNKPEIPGVVTYYPPDGSSPYECVPKVGASPPQPPAQPTLPQYGEFPSTEPPTGQPPLVGAPPSTPSSETETPLPGSNSTPKKPVNDTIGGGDIFSGSPMTANPLGFVCSVTAVLAALIVSIQ